MNKLIHSFGLIIALVILMPCQAESYFQQSPFEVVTNFPGPKSIYKDVQHHRMHIAYLDTEICKIQAGNLPNISISEINRRVNLMDARLAYFQEYNNSVEVRKSPDYSLPQNLTVQEVTYKFGSELSYLQANLISGKSLNDKKFQKSAEVNQEKIREIEWEMEDYRTAFKAKIQPWDASDLPPGPNDEDFGEEVYEEVIAVVDEKDTTPEFEEVKQVIEEPEVVPSDIPEPANPIAISVPEPAEPMVDNSIKENPVKEETTVSTLVLTPPEPTEIAEVEETITENKNKPAAVIDEVEKEKTPSIEDTKIMHAAVAPDEVNFEETKETPVEETSTLVVIEEVVQPVKENKSTPAVTFDAESSHPVVRTPDPTEGVSGEFRFYEGEVERISEKFYILSSETFKNSQARDAALVPIKQRLALVKKQLAGRTENQQTMDLISRINEDITLVDMEIASYEEYVSANREPEVEIVTEVITTPKTEVVEITPVVAKPIVIKPVVTQTIVEVEEVVADQPIIIPPPVSRQTTTVQSAPVVQRVVNAKYMISGYEKWHFFFDNGQASHRPNQIAQMGEIIELMEHNPEAYVVIKGYTDKTGSNETNMALSQKRAESVMNFFVQKGIDINRIQIQSLGDVSAIRNIDPFARRVEVKLKTNG